MEKDDNLRRFIDAQRRDYQTALSEIRNGKKKSHWMWYIFPQIKGLGRSPMSEYYGICDLREAQNYLKDPYLGNNLREISNELLLLDTNDARCVMGRPDDMKLKSSMTLFSLADPDDALFRKVLEKYYNGNLDQKTVKLLKFQENRQDD